MSTRRSILSLAATSFAIAGFALARQDSSSSSRSNPQGPAASTEAAKPLAYKQQRGPYEVDSLLETWRDETRKRDVPVLVWFPKNCKAPSAVIVFSHGLGGSREHYAHYGQHWASWGYVSVHVQHLGSDTSVWKDNPHAGQSMRKAATDLDNLLGRPKDIRFAIDELTRREQRDDWPLHGKLDLKHVGVAGHSFGAYTALCIAGRHLIGLPGLSVDLRDPRVSACIAMSSPAMQRERANGSYADISIPCFHMTGTEDASMVGEADMGVRRLPFDAMQKSDEYLLDLEGAHHLAFSDNEPVSPPRNPEHWPLIYSSSTAFWDAYLLHDETALKWLRDGGFTALLGKLGTFEHKSPDASAQQAPAAPKKDG